jgi:hypothetical protein
MRIGGFGPRGAGMPRDLGTRAVCALGCGRKRRRSANLLVDKLGFYGIMRAGDDGMRRRLLTARQTSPCCLGFKAPTPPLGGPLAFRFLSGLDLDVVRVIVGRARQSDESPSGADWPPLFGMGGNR